MISEEEDDAEDGEHAFAPVEHDPADVQGDRAAATRQMPRTVKKMTDRRRPLIIR